MQPHIRTLAGALALATLIPSTAFAQNLAQEVASGAFAPSTVPITVNSGGDHDPVHTIKSNDDALKARMYDVIPPNMLVNYDFDQTMLFLAVDGRTSGPGSVSISVARKNLLSTSWVPLQYLEVTVTRRMPAPGSISLPAAIRPYTLVKMPKSNELIIPRVVTSTTPMPPPMPLSFTEILRVLVTQPASSFVPNPHQDTQEVEVKASGQVVITSSSSPGLTGIPPLRGTATRAELRKLSDAVRDARFNSIPIDLGTGLPQFTFRVVGLAGGDRKIQGVRGQEGQHKPRLDAVHAALDAIVSRLRGTPPTGLGFTEMNRATKEQRVAINWTGPGGMPNPPMEHEDIRIRANGDVKFQRWSSAISAPTPAVTGTATQAELQRLARAIRDARFNQIPKDLGSGLPQYTFMVLGLPTGDRKVQGARGMEGQYKFRLDRVHAAIDAIRDRLNNTTPAFEFTEINRSTKEQRVAINWTGPGGMPNPPMHHEDIRIRANGEVKFSRWTNQAGVGNTGATGTATKAELTSLANAIRNARFNQIPKDLGSGLPQFTFMVLGIPAGDRKIQGVRGQEGQYKARLDAVHAVIDAIRDRIGVPQPPAGLGFTSIERRMITTPSFHPTPPFPGFPTSSSTVATEVEANGKVTISRWSSPGIGGIPPQTGTATKAELETLAKAIKDARFNEIPQDLPGAGPDSYNFRVIGIPGGDRKMSGVSGAEGQYRTRINAVHKALDAIQTRVETAAFRGFDLVSRTQTFPIKNRNESLLIDSDGNATLKTGGVPPMLEPALRTITGKLTTAEMKRLSRAVRDGNLSTVPTKLPTPVHIVAGDMFSLKVSAFGGEDEGSTKGEIGYYTSYATQLKPIMDALDAISARLQLQTPPKLYFEITKITKVPSEVAEGEQLEIEVRGIRPSTATLVDVETELKSFETLPPTWELHVNAVGKHNLTMGDAAIERPFRKTIRVKIPGDLTVVFNTKFLNGSARFEREVKVKKPTRGIVDVTRVGNKRAVWLVDGSNRIRVMPTSFARKLVKFEGHEVVVQGKMINSQTVRAKTLVSPVRQDISGVVSVSANGDVTIGGSWGPWPPIGPFPPMPPVIPFNDNGPSNTSIMPFLSYSAFGPALKVAIKASGLRITADAWVFENNRRPFRPTKAYLLGLRATVLEDSKLTRRGRKVNEVKENQQVLVTHLNRRGTQGRVQPKSGRDGYMPIGKLELGDKVFHILPAAGDTSGLIGGVSGASQD